MKDITEEIVRQLRKREFVSVATCDLKHNPNGAPKFVLKIEKNCIFLIDYIMGKTYLNLKVNPKASLAFVDFETLMGYQINGDVAIIEKGPVFNRIFRELDAKKVSLTAKHIVAEIRGGAKHESFEVMLPEKFVILKVCPKEIVRIMPTGSLERSVWE